MSTRYQLASLQVCRAIAAVLVLFDHFTLESSYFLGAYFLHDFFLFGRNGVTFFFVLSGFIICYAHYDDINGSFYQLKKYFIKRFTRIYPAYWPILFIVCAMFIFFGHLSHNTMYAVETDALTLLKNMFLVAYDKEHPIVTVAWTLEYEVIFYIFFGLFIISANLGLSLLCFWIAAILSYQVGFITTENVYIKFFLSFYITQFMIGILAAYICKKFLRKINYPNALLLTGIILFLLLGLYEDYYYHEILESFWLRTGYAIASFLIIIALVKLESIKHLYFPAILVLIGNASYALYLMHRTVLAVLYRVAQKFPLHAYPHIRYLILSFGILGGTILLACLYHKFYELPMMNASRKLLNRIFLQKKKEMAEQAI